VTSTSPLPGLAAPAGDPPLIGRGSSLAGSFGGWVYARDGWPGVAAFVGALSVLALVVAMKLARVPPPAHLRAS
jgi:hypothetical protein